jgi:hypothetical protein
MLKASAIWIGLAVALGLAADAVVCTSQQRVPADAGRTITPISHLGRITGVVVDSLHGGGLANADVLAEGVTVVITHTDSVGRFSIDSVRPGEYHLSVSHALLDTLGMSLITPHFRVVSDSVSYVILAVPSTPSLINLKCENLSRSAGSSAIVGHIVSPDSLQPIPNAAITLSWTTYSVSKANGVEKTPHAERDTTGRTGAYRICGLPNDLQANLEVRVGGELRSVSRVAIPDSGISLVVRNIILPTVLSLPSGKAAMIAGRVELANGQLGAGSSIEISGTGLTTLADGQGKFELYNVPLGAQTIRVRHLGYKEELIVVDIASPAAQGMIITLKETVPILPTVSVTASERDRALDHVGFLQRSKHSVGHFLTADQIATKSDFRFTDLLRGIPGIRVGIDKYGEDVVSSPRAGGSMLNPTQGCVQYFVDGLPWGNGALDAPSGRAEDSSLTKMRARMAIETAREINASLQKSDILGIEIYQGGGAPAYFNQGGHNCATIAIWTKGIL